jgi:hypothetical protein
MGGVGMDVLTLDFPFGIGHGGDVKSYIPDNKRVAGEIKSSSSTHAWSGNRVTLDDLIAIH